MLRFECDYGEGAAPAVLELLQKTNFDQTPGYGEDEYCAKAAAQIKRLCDAPDADVHFFVGATQANLTVIAAALKPWQGVLCADSGHIHVHETGSIEATGHKCLALPGKNGKITARQIRKAVEEHRANASHEHEVLPGHKLVRVAFGGTQTTDKPLVASLAIECGALVSIMAADTRIVNGQTLGSMLLALPDDDKAAAALEYIRNYPGITFEEVNG